MKKDKFCANYYAEKDAQGKITALNSQLEDEIFELKTMTNGYKGLFSKKNFVSGEFIYSCKSLIVSPEQMNEKMRLMINGKEFSTIDKDIHTSDYIDGKKLLYFWDSYMNHSCNPNTCTKNSLIFQDEHGTYYYDTFAVRDIKAGEEILCDYNSFYYDLEDSSFDCTCGSENCKKLVRGFKYLEPEQKRNYLSLIKKDDEILYSYFVGLMKKDSDIPSKTII